MHRSRILAQQLSLLYADTVKQLLERQGLYEVREPLYRETAEFVVEACVQSKSLLVSRLLMQLELLAEEGDALGER